MQILKSFNDVSLVVDNLSGTLGLVPTMGCLHAGHLSLIKQARMQNDFVAVSIFVNPIQFESEKDAHEYPRNFESDIAMLESENVDFVFIPDSGEVFPYGYQTYVTVTEISRVLEGSRRPGHMRGVATIVTKLLVVFRPDSIYCGQKDGQQSILIKRLVKDLRIPVDVQVCPTVRDSDGLALSSRNIYLSAKERKSSLLLYSSLCSVQDAFRDGIKNSHILRNIIANVLTNDSLLETVYISIADFDTLEELDQVCNKALCSIAVKVGSVVLIDNIILEEVLNE